MTGPRPAAGGDKKPAHRSNFTYPRHHASKTLMESPMLTVLGRLVAALWLAATLTTAASAQQTQTSQAEPRDIAVATRILPPLVVEQKDTLSGFSIELWNAIAGRLKLTTNYQAAPNV